MRTLDQTRDQHDAEFYAGLPTFADAAGITDMANYHAVPQDWLVATTDVVNSTAAVAAGRYKVVNTAGASVISAVANTLQHREFPFVFGGDGAGLAVPGSARSAIEAALAAVRTWALEDLQIELRAALMPVADIRKAGVDVRVARFQVAPEVSYAMFAGGGLVHAETVMKQGHGMIDAAPAGTRPDLTGLSCRWQPVHSRHGAIVSLLAVPGAQASQTAFMQLVSEVLDLAGRDRRMSHPLPPEGLRFQWPPRGLSLELAASAHGLQRVSKVFSILGEQAIGWLSDRTGWSFGRFNARDYRRDVAQNSDFRKFDDGLKLTIDVAADLSDQIEQRLQRAENDGICVYGLHRQSEALVTCIVPSPVTRDHIHFIDGADGGYVSASQHLKAKL